MNNETLGFQLRGAFGQLHRQLSQCKLGACKVHEKFNMQWRGRTYFIN